MERTMGRAARRITLWVLVVVALVNVPLTLEALSTRPWTKKADKPRTQDAAVRGEWPARTPHEKEWPAPTDFMVEHSFGRTQVQAWTVAQPDPKRIAAWTTHKIVDSRYGWPLTTLRRTQYWWPDNQEWRIDSPWDTGLRVSWAGAVLNPVIAAATVWGVLFGPGTLRRTVVGRWRRRRGRCPACGYPVGVSPVCTECGGVVRSPYDRG